MKINLSVMNSNSKTILTNALSLSIRMFLSILISFFTIRMMIEYLGVIDYGIYSLIAGVVLLFGFLDKAMTSSSQRFLSYSLASGSGKTHLVYTSLVLINIVTILCLVILAEIIGPYAINNFLDIPQDRLISARWLFHLSLVTLFVNFMKIPIIGLFVAKEQMGVFAFVGVLENILKLASVSMIIYVKEELRLLYLGMFYACVSIIIYIVHIVLRYYYFKGIRLIRSYDKGLILKIFSFSTWSLIGNLSTVFKLQGIAVILNIFFGPTGNAVKGIVQQIRGSLEGFALTVQLAVKPQVIKSYSQNHIGRMNSLVMFSARGIFLLMLAVLLPVGINLHYYVAFWLSDYPDFVVLVARVVFIEILIAALSKPLINVAQAVGQMKQYMIAVGGLQLLILPLSYILLRIEANILLPYLVSLLISSVGLFVRIYILRKYLGIELKEFGSKVLLRSFFVAMTVIFCVGITYLLLDSSDLLVPIRSVIYSFEIVLISVIIGLDKIERKRLISFIKYD